MEHQHESLLSDPRLWVAVSFTIFFLIFGRRLWQIAIGLLDKRAVAIQAEIQDASRLRVEAEALLREASARREEALREAEAMLENARHEATRVGQIAQADAHAVAARRERMALDRISAAEQAAVTEVRLAAADLASIAARDVIAQSFSVEMDATCIDQGIRSLPASLSSRRAA